jgi:hypothetical protein
MSIDELSILLFESYCKKACAILGDDDFVGVMAQVREQVFIMDPHVIREKFFRIRDHKVYSNEIPGTRGFWIGEESDIELLLHSLKVGEFHR